MKMKVKKLDERAIMPSQAKSGDAGYDLVAIDDGTISPEHGFIEYRTGIAIEVPEGFHTEIFPRSSISKYDLALANSIGLVDGGYRGEVLVRFKYAPPFHADGTSLLDRPIIRYKKGDKIAQLVVRQTVHVGIEEVEELSDTARGAGGFGSTG